MKNNQPLEIQYIFKKFPEFKDRIKTVEAQGKKIEVRAVPRTSADILKAVHAISVHSQYNYIVTWLPKLLKDKHFPKFTESDYLSAASQGEDLDKAVALILKERLNFKKLILVDDNNNEISAIDQQLMLELSELIYPLVIDYAVFRVVADNARERTKIAQEIIKALLIIGPIAHVLEMWMRGIGKIFAASADDILGESAELLALRGSGFKWKELIKRSGILIPVFALAAWGAFSVEGLIVNGHTVWAGIVFGFSAVALSLTTAVQSIFMYRQNLLKLVRAQKVEEIGGWDLIKTAFVQDFTNPARMGLLIGAAIAPIMGIIGSVSGLMHNGWVLAIIGSTESIVAGLTVIFADLISENRFKKKLKIALR